MCLFPIPSWLFVLLLAFGGLPVDADAWGQETQSGSAIVQPQAAGQSLAGFVREYLVVEDQEVATSLLQEILAHPRASLERVSAVLQEGRTYQAALVGMLPSQPVRVRDKTFSYGLFVPPAYDPDVALPLVVCLHGRGLRAIHIWNAGLRGWVSGLSLPVQRPWPGRGGPGRVKS